VGLRLLGWWIYLEVKWWSDCFSCMSLRPLVVMVSVVRKLSSSALSLLSGASGRGVDLVLGPRGCGFSQGSSAVAGKICTSGRYIGKLLRDKAGAGHAFRALVCAPLGLQLLTVCNYYPEARGSPDGVIRWTSFG